MERMVYQKYILNTYRLLMNKWWLSLIKLCSMAMGIISFLLVWLFYIDHQPDAPLLSFVETCSWENLLILSAIFLITISIYVLILKSQMTFRYKEFFIRRYYGESGFGIVLILLIETIIFVIFSLIISLVFIDQITPFFNLITEKTVNTRQVSIQTDFFMLIGLMTFIGFIIGIFPVLVCAKKRAVDLLKKLPE